MSIICEVEHCIVCCGLPPSCYRNVVVVHQAEARLASRRAARAEARDIRMRELEKQQQEVGGLLKLLPSRVCV